MGSGTFMPYHPWSVQPVSLGKMLQFYDECNLIHRNRSWRGNTLVIQIQNRHRGKPIGFSKAPLIQSRFCSATRRRTPDTEQYRFLSIPQVQPRQSAQLQHQGSDIRQGHRKRRKFFSLVQSCITAWTFFASSSVHSPHLITASVSFVEGLFYNTENLRICSPEQPNYDSIRICSSFEGTCSSSKINKSSIGT